jgi:CelD/BcsL family acetyltransferase involved in cellulose biosynthesis
MTTTTSTDKPKAVQQRNANQEIEASDLTVLVVSGEELIAHEAAWERLAASAIAPNPFYEPWMMKPAIEHLIGPARVAFLLVLGPETQEAAGPELLGLFPLEVQRRCLHLPIKTLTLWQHSYCFLTLPLVHRHHAWPVLEAFWRWLEQNPFGCHVFDTNTLLAQGEFHEIWSDFALGRVSLMLNECARAALCPTGTADSYLASAISKDHLNGFARKERKLKQMGPCEYSQVASEQEADDWAEAYLRVEASGWKGSAPGGGAVASRPEDVRFFKAMTREGFAKGRVSLLWMHLNGAPIAFKYNLLCDRAAFAFKITFDETYSKQSPGVLLEFDHMRRVFAEGRLEWIDSCASVRHPMLNRIWTQRRMVRRTLYSDSSLWGDLLLSSVPLLRWINDRVRREHLPDYYRISTKTK